MTSFAVRMGLAALCLMGVAAAPAPAETAPRRNGVEYVRAFDHHTRTGYHQAGSLVPHTIKPAYRLLHGVPIVDYPGVGPRRNPTTTANWGLVNYSSWFHHHGARQLRHAIIAADFLVRTQSATTGKWHYRFDFPYSPTIQMRAPWSSALAQGEALSLMRRVYAATPHRRYLRAARRALRPFRKTVADGGLIRYRHGRTVYEEYAYPPRAIYVLNGFMQALVGLYDVSDVLPEARSLFDRGMRALPRIIREYRLPGGRSTYDLTHLTLGAPAFAVSDPYHAAHVGLLRLLNRVRPHPVLAQVRNEWMTTVSLPQPAG